MLLFADLLTKHLKDAVAFTDAVSKSHKHELHKVRMPTGPLNAGAWDFRVKRCFDVETTGSGLPVEAATTTGWTYTNEIAANKQYMKPGWISNKTGDVLTLRLSTVLQPKFLEDDVTLTVEFLKSYENMGSAHVACVSGCKCEQHFVIDATEKLGRTSMESFQNRFTNVTQVENCVLRVTSILEEKQRFKLLGIVIQTKIRDLNTHMIL